jgi:glycosyltransferase involved in cell wall biosynthesis
MKPIKVAHVSTVDSSLRYLLLRQLHSFQRAGYEVVGISAPGPDVPALEAAGVRHIAVPMTRNFTPHADAVSLWRLYRVMRREAFDIVHTHTPKAGLLGQLAARLAGVPVVVNTVHGFYFHDHMHPLKHRFYTAVESIGARCSDTLLSQNREDVRTAVREGVCPAEKIRWLGNGIDLGAFDPDRIARADVEERRGRLGLPPGARVVGFVGRLAAKRKGFLDFLRAAEQVARQVSEAWFLIVGDADRGKPDAVEPSAAREYGVGERCLFLGQRPNAELPLLYSLMDVLVLPSLFEGVPRVIMETSAMGVPAVATDVKGNREAVEPGRNGLLVPLGDVPALAGAILEVLTDRKKARRMGAEGRRIAAERFDERLVFRKVRSEYERLLRQKGLPVPRERPSRTSVPV